jgi:hypothetical protein
VFMPCAVPLNCHASHPRGCPPFHSTRFLQPADAIFRGSPRNPADDVVTQFAKVAVGLLTDKYGALAAAASALLGSLLLRRPFAT